MPRFAMMSGNSVDNIVVAENKESTERTLRCVLIPLSDDSEVGFGWRFIDGEWQAPPEESPVE